MNYFSLGCLFAFLSVALGAFGAHALKERLSPEYLAIFETAVRYQMYHALGLIALGLIATRLESNLSRVAGISFMLGIVFFSGSLYALVGTGMRWLGAITPLGGLAFLIGWLCLALAGSKWYTENG